MCSEHSQKSVSVNVSPAARLLIAAGHFYQHYLSGLKGGPSCRFDYPSAGPGIRVVSTQCRKQPFTNSRSNDPCA